MDWDPFQPKKVTAVGLFASGDSCGCNFGVVGVVLSHNLSETTCVYFKSRWESYVT